MIHTNYFPPRCFCLDSAPPPRQVLQHLAGLLKQNILPEWMLLLLFSLDTIWHLDTIWPRCTPGPWSTSTRCSASDGGYLRRQKANGQLENTAGSPSQRLAQQGPARMPTLYAVEIWDRQESRVGATIHALGLRDDDDVIQTSVQWRGKRD